MYSLNQVNNKIPIDYDAINLSECLIDPIELTEKLWYRHLHDTSPGPYSQSELNTFLKSAYITIKLLEARLS